MYCFECADPVHDPVTCKQLETFKNHTDEESYLWIATNAKNCPGCKAPIEKNEGCNHMVIINLFTRKLKSFVSFCLSWFDEHCRHVKSVDTNFVGYA